MPFQVDPDPVRDVEAQAEARYYTPETTPANKEGRVGFYLWRTLILTILGIVWFGGLQDAVTAYTERIHTLNERERTGPRLASTYFDPINFGHGDTGNIEIVFPAPSVLDGVITQSWVKIEELRRMGNTTQKLTTPYRPVNISITGSQASVVIPTTEFPMDSMSSPYRYRFSFMLELKPTLDSTEGGRNVVYAMRTHEVPPRY